MRLRALVEASVEDPGAISFDARLLWQGPFATLAPSGFPHFLGVGTLAVVVIADETLLDNRTLREADNAVALGLYQSLGFTELYRYHYRQQPAG